MIRTQKILMRLFATFVGVSLLTAVLFETDLLPCGFLKGVDTSSEFVAATFMELLTLCFIPVALRLFKFQFVANSLTSASSMLRWASIRMLMLCLPMVANTLLYYMYMNVAFGYMAIILLLCLAFVLPTKSRCEQEIRSEEDAENKA